jgi:hypothetical protein
VENAGNGLPAEFVIPPAEESSVIHFGFWFVARHAHSPVHDDVLGWYRQHLARGVELPTEIWNFGFALKWEKFALNFVSNLFATQ